MVISHIVSVDENNVIGNENKIPWNIPNDRVYFKNKTIGHHILMGRKTYDSIGKVLPKRTSLIVSSQKNLIIPDTFVFNSVESAVSFAKKNNETDLFIIGGSEIYNLTEHIIDTIYLTKVHHTFIGDVKYDIEIGLWKEIKKCFVKRDEKNPYDHSFIELVRKK
ncbi:MAG: dihydrofolate reductase [Chitinophagaceae bacterium]|nr:dihydrofolate reductase [Chitinophagaceae bacterium]